MSNAVLEATKVSKVLGHGAGQVHALRGVDLSLRGGELTLLMGPSGSGKTTLLSVLGCMLAPTSGKVSVCGHDTTDADPERLASLRRDHIGFIFQTYHLFPTLTAVENVQLALDVRGEPGAPARERARAALAQVGLAHKLDSFPREMSGGEQQRVAIARAVANAPRILLADEPTGNLDVHTADHVFNALTALVRASGLATIIATHNMELAARMDRRVTLREGRVVEME